MPQISNFCEIVGCENESQYAVLDWIEDGDPGFLCEKHYREIFGYENSEMD